MAFGQQSGPPATAKQVQDLLSLLANDGYDDFRDARGAMGFTQRQAGGKFTRDEAATFIDQLELTQDPGPPPAVASARRPAASRPAAPAATPPPPRIVGLDHVPSERLAAELRRRGWTLIAPPDTP